MTKSSMDKHSEEGPSSQKDKHMQRRYYELKACEHCRNMQSSQTEMISYIQNIECDAWDRLGPQMSISFLFSFPNSEKLKQNQGKN